MIGLLVFKERLKAFYGRHSFVVDAPDPND